MNYTDLGKSDLKVSRICMGCMGFGDAAAGQHSWTVDESRAREIIKHGLELGMHHLAKENASNLFEQKELDSLFPDTDAREWDKHFKN